ncbi:MAG: hypothetical protein J7K45_02735 [Thaumarchaeota archaeon]|nr:hypothetical protein [Nitrososphaerota archaeon]
MEASKDGFLVLFDGRPMKVKAAYDGANVRVEIDGRMVKLRTVSGGVEVEEGRPKLLKSEIPAKVVSIYVGKGSRVKRGEELMVLESMKMENVIRAPFDCVVKDVKVKEGDMVSIGDLLIEFE